MKLKVIFNCSINVIGGAVQNSANFIKYAVNDTRFEYCFIVSPEVHSILERWQVPLLNVEKVESPSKNLATIERIKEIEEEFCPDLIYTMAGPTYINFKTKHVLGISDPYITHANLKNFFKNRSFYEGAKHLLKVLIKAYRSRIEGNFFLFQTETSRNGFCSRYFINADKTFVVPNALGEHFLNYDFKGKSENQNEFHILYPSAYYPHKNIELITSVVDILRKRTFAKKIVFLLTINEKTSFLNNLKDYFDQNTNVYIKNLKPFSYADAVEVYKDADLVFFPSLLETFSTSYLEAMIAKKNLLVADLPFAREICKNYAQYFMSESADEAALKISRLIESDSVESDLSCAQSILNEYGSQDQRYQKIASLLLRIGKDNVI